jgi:hypothetical protein
VITWDTASELAAARKNNIDASISLCRGRILCIDCSIPEGFLIRALRPHRIGFVHHQQAGGRHQAEQSRSSLHVTPPFSCNDFYTIISS